MQLSLLSSQHSELILRIFTASYYLANVHQYIDRIGNH
jgi:hypothetical protein